jgi:hypothetical protein
MLRYEKYKELDSLSRLLSVKRKSSGLALAFVVKKWQSIFSPENVLVSPTGMTIKAHHQGGCSMPSEPARAWKESGLSEPPVAMSVRDRE